MGREARCNPRVKLAEEGKLPPKKKKLSKKESERIVMDMTVDYFFDKFNLPKGGAIYDQFKTNNYLRSGCGDRSYNSRKTGKR